MSKMKAVQVGKPGGNFELVERSIPEPARNQVRIKVEACGICHSDALVKEGHWPGLQYPRVPGHEIAGRDRRRRCRRRQLETRPARRSRMARRPLFHLRSLPPRRLHQLPERKNHRHQPRWWLSGIHARARRSRRRHPRRPGRRRGCAAALCRHHRVQCVAQCGRARAGDLVAVQGIGGTGPSRNPVCAADGLPHLCHRPRQGQRSAGPKARRHALRRYRRWRSGRRIAKIRRRPSDSRHRARFQVYFRPGERALHPRHPARGRCQPGPDHRNTPSIDPRQQVDPRMGLRASRPIPKTRCGSARCPESVR